MVNKYQMAKRFIRTSTDTSFSYARNPESIAREAVLDGFYVLRTNVPAEQLDAPWRVLAYKSLAHVEQAFRHFKLSDRKVAPHLPLQRAAGAGAPLAVHAGLLGAAGAAAGPWRRCSSWTRRPPARPTGGAGTPLGAGPPLGGSTAEGPHPAHRRDPAGAPLPDAPRSPGLCLFCGQMPGSSV